MSATLDVFQDVFCGRHSDTRCKGSTTALIGVMLTNPNAVMLVQNYQAAFALSKQYNIDMNRFITVGTNGTNKFHGRTFNGPILTDLPALAEILSQVRASHKDEIDALKTDNLEVVKDTIFLNKRVDVLNSMNAELRKRNTQLIAKFKNIDDIMTAKDIDEIKEDGLTHPVKK